MGQDDQTSGPQESETTTLLPEETSGKTEYDEFLERLDSGEQREHWAHEYWRQLRAEHDGPLEHSVHDRLLRFYRELQRYEDEQKDSTTSL